MGRAGGLAHGQQNNPNSDKNVNKSEAPTTPSSLKSASVRQLSVQSKVPRKMSKSAVPMIWSLFHVGHTRGALIWSHNPIAIIVKSLTGAFCTRINNRIVIVAIAEVCPRVRIGVFDSSAFIETSFAILQRTFCTGLIGIQKRTRSSNFRQRKLLVLRSNQCTAKTIQAVRSCKLPNTSSPSDKQARPQSAATPCTNSVFWQMYSKSIEVQFP